MSLILLAYTYATVAFIVAGYVYYREVLARETPKEFELEDRAVLSIAAFGVGVLWVLFVPALTVLWALQVARFVEVHLPKHLPGWPRAVRVRS